MAAYLLSISIIEAELILKYDRVWCRFIFGGGERMKIVRSCNRG